MKRKNGTLVGLVLCMVLMLTGCGTVPELLGLETDHPVWVEKGAGFFLDGRGLAVYGVGGSRLTQDVTLDRTAADTRARADVARSISADLTDLVKSYQKKVSDANASDVEEWVQTATESFSKMDLVGVEIIDRHKCKRDNVYYALARMNLASFNKTVDEIQALSGQAKKTIQQHAESVFEEMARRSE